jgi:hypothetical protein
MLGMWTTAEGSALVSERPQLFERYGLLNRRRTRMANPTSPVPNKSKRPGWGAEEARTTVGAANEFTTDIKISNAGTEMRTGELLSP